MFNGAQIHLLLNHIPVVGSGMGFLMLAVALVFKSEEMKKISFVFFILFALVAIPTYLSGDSAKDVIEHLPGVSKNLIEDHDESATVSLIGIELMGAVGVVGLFFLGRANTTPKWLVMISLIVAVATSGAMAWTGHLGGLIRHPEIRAGFKAPTSSKQTTGSTQQSGQQEKEEGLEIK